MRIRRWFPVMGGFLMGAAAAGGYGVYGRRSRLRRSGQESLDDPAVAQAYGKMAQLPQLRVARRLVVRRATHMVPSGTAVDLGCGTGLLAIELARHAPELQVIGVDLAQEMLTRGEAEVAAAGLAQRITFRQGDVTRIPLDDHSVDLVVSTLSLHHWSDPVAVLNEIARVLRPGGGFVIADLRRDMSAPAWLSLWFSTRFVVPRALKNANEPLSSRNAAYTSEEAAELAARSGLHGGRVTTGPLWLMIEGRI